MAGVPREAAYDRLRKGALEVEVAVGEESFHTKADDCRLRALKTVRILAFFLDLLLCAACADFVALAVTAVLWRLVPSRGIAIPAVWAAAATVALGVFLLRDARGGRARRWFGLEAVRMDGRPPGPAASIRRNLPLLVPGWNLFEAWPVLRNGSAGRPSDRRTGVRIRVSDR